MPKCAMCVVNPHKKSECPWLIDGECKVEKAISGEGKIAFPIREIWSCSECHSPIARCRICLRQFNDKKRIIYCSGGHHYHKSCFEDIKKKALQKG